MVTSDKASELYPVIDFEFTYSKSPSHFVYTLLNLMNDLIFLQIEFCMEILYKTRSLVVLQIDIFLEELLVVQSMQSGKANAQIRARLVLMLLITFLSSFNVF